MRVVMENVTVIDAFTGVSAKGREYGRLKLLTTDFDVFELFVPGSACDKLQGLEPRTQIKELPFDMVAGFEGGVQLRPAW